ncbi:sensor histidine kinase [Williamsia sp. DF01-3]|uniref:sensor histidine kinase n=1 Tax=Williamsia sp. DF01-3 TaxID=2934157 RepID=UPI001FF58A6B|nr:ATP-binding protein [Williamsia sp. DF01-3]MCK0515720.1 ATP-binding protein [Williamsia sp. DF01-3]
MATDSTTYAPPALTTDSPDTALDRTAGRRILRQFAVFIACGYLAYLILTLPAITASLQVMHLGWTIPALLCVFGPGLILGPLAWRAPTRRLKVAAAITASGYVVAIATWWFGWTGEHLTGNTDIWFSYFCGLAAIAAALALPPRYSFVVLVGVVVLATVINHAVRASAANGPLVPDIAWAFAFSLVYFAAAVMGMRTAAVLDDTRAQAYSVTAQAAAAQARTVERQRFNQLTHDGVMSTLLVAARQGNSDHLARQAQATLADLDTMREGTNTTETLPVDAAVAHLRLAITTADPHARLRVHDRGRPAIPFPGPAVRTIAAATAEAVRNSHRHANSATPTTVTVSLDDLKLQVAVSDNGIGFDPGTVPADRLGIAVSIRDRMNHIGGSAVIDSAPGHGTHVTLYWEQQHWEHQ